ncbi:MAG: helix-turn-helix domain-containing protein [Gemmataceae bacterium]|nr:helix-turn-helix domain-containing protein [Gemmataceae bacterium]
MTGQSKNISGCCRFYRAGALAFQKENGQVLYFNGHMPVFIHEEKDVATFRMIAGQFCVNGNAKQAEIARAFGVTAISVKRAVKLYREKGPSGFYVPRPTRGAAVLLEPVVAEIEEFLAAGLSEADIAKRMGLKRDTLRKAIRAGRVRAPIKKKKPLPTAQR